MKTAEKFLQDKGLKDSLYDVHNEISDQWIKGGLSKLLDEYASTRSMERMFDFVEWIHKSPQYSREYLKTGERLWYNEKTKMSFTHQQLYDLYRQEKFQEWMKENGYSFVDDGNIYGYLKNLDTKIVFDDMQLHHQFNEQF